MQRERQGIDTIIRKTEAGDLDAVGALFDEARKTIAALGIDQWQTGYPDRSDAEIDLREGVSWVAEESGDIAASFALVPDGEPTYDVIEEGHWLTGEENRRYLTVHRFAVAVRYRGRGLAGELLTFAEEKARDGGLKSIRIDTHEGNVVMRRMLEKNGFALCGVIYLENGDRRAAYEKVV